MTDAAMPGGRAEPVQRELDAKSAGPDGHQRASSGVASARTSPLTAGADSGSRPLHEQGIKHRTDDAEVIVNRRVGRPGVPDAERLEDRLVKARDELSVDAGKDVVGHVGPGHRLQVAPEALEHLVSGNGDDPAVEGHVEARLLVLVAGSGGLPERR